ncbi:MAG: hypothetical protein D6776_11780 [Planctomycetota bacterium]|nr:MAG: hypothetical protein D6776_11780 [Planctomycetota bacterium]
MRADRRSRRVFCPRCETAHERCHHAATEVIVCDCGHRFRLRPSRRARRLARTDRARAALRQLGRRADRLCRLILDSRASEIEIAMERHRLRAFAQRLFPERMELYDMVFESRFERLYEQFRRFEDPCD